jgi:hypothetical protein
MGNCCGGSATVPPSSLPQPVPARTAPSAHSTSAPSPHVASAHSAVTPERMRSQDSTSSQPRRGDRDYPPLSSGSNPQEIPSYQFRSRGGNSPQHERRPRFPSTLQNLLSNDFRCVVRCRADSHNNCCTIIHRFRILVVGKVCIVYHTGRRRN